MVSISFKHNKENIRLIGDNSVEVFKDVCDWLYKNGYDFKSDNIGGRKIYTIEEIEENKFPLGRFHKISTSDMYIPTTMTGNISARLRNLITMLTQFGIEESSIKSEDFETTSRIKKFGEIETDEEDLDPDDDSHTELSLVKPDIKMTFIEAAQLILKQNDNQLMSAREIWDEIEEQDLVETKGTTPCATLNAEMLSYSDNTNISRKKKVKLFTIVSTNPAIFILINPENEIQPASEDDELDLELPTKTSTFTLPEDDALLGDILPFTHFRGVQSQEEREKVKSTEPIEPVNNPFMQAVCILGKSGRGKSTTIDNMLESYPNMEYDFIIPTASTTGLLSQFSPTSGKTGGGGYIPSRLGKMIMDARNNPEILYTAVFDECHKASIIEMINDELLQCISTERNKGNRFISLDTETESLFSGLKDYRGNLLLPDNFGFIFLSSKPDVITSNDDFFRRVNIYILKKVNDYDSIDYLDMVRETGEKDKNGKPTYRLNEEYFTFVEGKSKEDIQQIEKLNDEE